MKTPLQVIAQYWNYQAFKPKQEAIIESVMQGRDTVALLPTGGGKSLCFQVPALLQDGICIVISPLVALMNDQVKELQQRGIKAIALSGGISYDEVNTLLHNAIYGNYKFLYLSPERLQQDIVKNCIQKMSVNLIAVDEAHCISQWGNDFRPSYKNITVLKQLHPLVPTIALTATATIKVLQHTIEALDLKNAQVFKNSFIRGNLSYRVDKASDKLYRLVQILKENTGSAIVYVRSRRAAEKTSTHLEHFGITSQYFHGGITTEEKKDRLHQWKNERISTMVATNAFGMGIDHGNVRYVIHIQLPESLESYFQEAGRAGRDGKKAHAILLYNEADSALAKKQFITSIPNVKEIKHLYRTLNNYFQVSYGEGMGVSYSFSFIDFCNTYELPTLLTYSGLQMLDRLGVIQLSKEFGRKSIIQFLVSSDQLLHVFDDNLSFSVVGKTILRMYGGVFETPSIINIKLVASKLGLGVDNVISVLKEMEQQELLSLQLHETDASITFLVPREDDRTINPLRKEIEIQKDRKEKQLQAVFQYVYNAKECRQQQLVRYFGEEDAPLCGICSVCERPDSKIDLVATETVAQAILNHLKVHPKNSRNLIEMLSFTETEILNTLRLLLDSGQITINEANQYTKK